MNVHHTHLHHKVRWPCPTIGGQSHTPPCTGVSRPRLYQTSSDRIANPFRTLHRIGVGERGRTVGVRVERTDLTFREDSTRAVWTTGPGNTRYMVGSVRRRRGTHTGWGCTGDRGRTRGSGCCPEVRDSLELGTTWSLGREWRVS